MATIWSIRMMNAFIPGPRLRWLIGSDARPYTHLNGAYNLLVGTSQGFLITMTDDVKIAFPILNLFDHR